MPIIPINTPDDPRIAPYVSIREKDLTRGHGGRFIVEGKVTLETFLTRGRFAVESLFLAETRLSPLDDLLSRYVADVPVYVAPQAVMDAAAGFPMHRGVLACGLKGDLPTPSAFLATNTPGSPLLMLSGLSNHDNVGACFRNAAAFGAGAVLMDDQCCDPLYRKSIRVSAGTSLWLPYAFGGSGLEMVAAAKAAGYTVWAMTPQAGAAPLPALDVPDKLAILLGAEGPGLPGELIAAATPVRIPMAGGFDSINVATAGAIALSQAFPAPKA